jgi:pimeloyl-ACP methyl ester carboxylesterase
MATPLRFYSPRYFERVAPGLYGGMTARSPYQRQSAISVRCQQPPTSYGYAMQLLGGMGWSSLSFLPNIRHQTLVICGDDDPLVPVANGKMLAERIPRAELEVVERAGHLLLWDDAERVAPRIVSFVGN